MVEQGRLVMIDSGAYSDQIIMGFFVILESFDLKKKLEEYLVIHPKERMEYAFQPDQFLATLLAQGLLLEITYDNIYLSGYGEVSEVSFKRGV